MYSISSVLKSLPQNFIPIWFSGKYRGAAVQRILSAHPESAWEKSWCSSLDDSTTHPLQFPESVDSFLGSKENYYYKGGFKSAHAWAHTGLSLHSADKATVKNFARLSLKYPTKLVFFAQHPTDFSDIVVKKRNIFLFSSDFKELSKRPFKDINTLKKVEPINHPNVLNIDIARLFSSDYETFFNEYLQLVHYFDLTIQTNAVRAFILRYLERERYVSNF